NNIYFVQGIVAEDIEWMMALFSHDIRISAVEGIFNQYHKFRPGSNTSGSGGKAVESLTYIIDKWVPRLNKGDLKDNALLRFLSFHYSTLFLSYYKVSSSKRGELKPKIKQYFWLLSQSQLKRVLLIKSFISVFGFYLGSY